MQIKEILDIDNISDKIKALKLGRTKPLPKVDELMAEWDPRLHKTITDKQFLPDKMVKDETGSSSLQRVNRISLPFQKRIVNTAVSFTFGNPVKLNADPDGDDQTTVMVAMNRIDHDCKLKSFNRRLFRELLRSTEVAEMWHTLENKEFNDNYGFSTDKKIRVSYFAPFNGDTLFPYFDETGDMVAFSRGYKRNKEEYFEVFTDEIYIQWKMESGKWLELQSKPLPYGKIPIIYVEQESVEWSDVQICIERLELLLSKFGETNDYFASPTLFITGRILSLPKKGESGKVIEGEEGSKAEIVSWDNAPEAIKLEIETLIRFIHSQTQTPDISFDSVKGLSQISGEALAMLFTDATLKVEEKKEILDDFLQRRVNVQKAIIGIIEPKLKEATVFLEIEPEIIPFRVNDETTTIRNISIATGGKPIMSQKTGIKALGWVNNIDEELEQIEREDQSNLFEPTI